MKKLVYMAMLVAVLVGCSEAEELMFDSPNAIYFKKMYTDEVNNLSVIEDTVFYTFAFTPELQEREICIPVEIVGFPSSQERKYNIKVTECNGAKAGVHYESLNSEQVLGSGKTIDSLRVRFYKQDMDEQARKVEILIQPSVDFKEGIKDSLFVAIQVSNILEKPVWWDAWKTCFGEYHRIKYEEWMKIWGGKGTLPSNTSWLSWYMYPKELTALIQLKRLFNEKEFYDENGNRLTIPCPY